MSILECKQACTGLDWNFRGFLVGLLVTLPNNVVNTLISCKKCQCKRHITSAVITHCEHRKERDYAHACIMQTMKEYLDHYETEQMDKSYSKIKHRF